ncbi:MAG TPA: response regulator transcription factor [Polyangiaceae bacterium]|jgi:DNA-binding NarL/FixJ family response regulator|nr:response regulator transcription factor [Polyangiaceae bacterium]
MVSVPAEDPIRVMIVEDQTIFRELLAEVLAAEGRYAILGQFSTGLAAIEACPRLKPDVVILDAVLPDISGLDVLSRLLAVRPGLSVMMVTAHERPALVQDAVRVGAKGFVTKGTPLRELREGIRRVADRGTYFCSVTSAILASNLKSPPAEGELSPRQRQVVQLVARGLSSKEIADELSISVKTVANHRLQIRERLNLHDIASITRYAIERGLVEPKV